MVRDPDATDLTLRQLLVLVFMRDTPAKACTVRGMAVHLNVSRAVVTRAMDRLTEKHLATRRLDRCDRRSVLCSLTSQGRSLAGRFPARVARDAVG